MGVYFSGVHTTMVPFHKMHFLEELYSAFLFYFRNVAK